MNSLTQTDLLDFLCASLRHFQDNRDLGDETDVLEIERMLLQRIGKIESELDRTRTRSHKFEIQQVSTEVQLDKFSQQ